MNSEQIEVLIEKLKNKQFNLLSEEEKTHIEFMIHRIFGSYIGTKIDIVSKDTDIQNLVLIGLISKITVENFIQ